MPVPILDINHSKPLNSAITRPGSHPVKKCHLKDRPGIWFQKEALNPVIARQETLAQEFFRLIIPHQPITCLAENKSNQIYYVLSAAVPGFREISSDVQQQILSGRYKAFGAVILVSAFLRESDLKYPCHVGVDEHDNVTKIDGDWCFSHFSKPSKYDDVGSNMTPGLLNALPSPGTMKVFNWLNYVKEGYPVLDGAPLFDAGFSRTETFRREINQAVLKILLLPDWYIDYFCDSFFPCSAERWSRFLLERRQQLRHSALQDPSFQAFLHTELAATVSTGFIAHLHHFHLSGDTKQALDSDQRAQVSDDIQTRFDSLRLQPTGLYLITPAQVKMNWPVMQKSVLHSLIQPEIKTLTLLEHSFLRNLVSPASSSFSATSSSSPTPSEAFASPHDFLTMLSGAAPVYSRLAGSMTNAWICSLAEPFRSLALAVLAGHFAMTLEHMIQHYSGPSLSISEFFRQSSVNTMGLLLMAVCFEPAALGALLDAMACLDETQCVEILSSKTGLGYSALMMLVVNSPEYIERFLSILVGWLPENLSQFMSVRGTDGYNVVMIAACRNPGLLERLFCFMRERKLERTQMTDYRLEALQLVSKHHPDRLEEIAAGIERAMTEPCVPDTGLAGFSLFARQRYFKHYKPVERGLTNENYKKQRSGREDVPDQSIRFIR